jgi:hypothetical protein
MYKSSPHFAPLDFDLDSEATTVVTFIGANHSGSDETVVGIEVR